jgi:DNA-binding transcriptional LysR family regulator
MLPEGNDKATEWKDWDIFCKVAETGSFSAAGAKAGLPKSTVSSSIARLERQLGVRLLERTTRRVQVTDIGQKLFARAAPLFSALRDVEEEAKSTTQEVSGVLRVSTSYESGWLHLSPALTRILQKHSNLTVVVDDSRTIPDLVEQRYDVAFIKTATELPDSSLVTKRVASMDRAFYASPRLLEERGTPEAPADIEMWPAIVDADDKYWEAFKSGKELDRLPIRPRIRTSNAEIQLRAALDGLGIARLATRMVQRYVDTGELVRVLTDYTSSPIKFYAVMPARRHTPPKVRVLLDAIEATAVLDATTGLAYQPALTLAAAPPKTSNWLYEYGEEMLNGSGQDFANRVNIAYTV